MKTKQFLTISERRTDRFSAKDFEAQVKNEAIRAKELYAEGFIRQIWHRADGKGACILSEARDLDHVKEMLNSLPMVSKGMLEIKNIIELAPYKGFCHI